MRRGRSTGLADHCKISSAFLVSSAPLAVISISKKRSTRPPPQHSSRCSGVFAEFERAIIQDRIQTPGTAGSVVHRQEHTEWGRSRAAGVRRSPIRDLVGAGKDGWRYRQAERLGGLELDGFPISYSYLASCYATMGRLDKARATIKRLRTIMAGGAALQNPEHRELFLSGLRFGCRRGDMGQTRRLAATVAADVSGIRA